MSTKKIQRTVIEGGRHGYNKWERRNSHNEERASEKVYCNQAKLDPESIDDYDIKEKTIVHKEFTDKLSPMYRWLDKQVGNPWNDVRSEIANIFDTRTTAGRHIVYDHLLRSVEITPDVWRFNKWYSSTIDNTTSHSKHDFYVDDLGVLCKRRYIPRRYNRHPLFDTAQIANWLSGRVVGKVGKKLFWFIPADKNKKYGGYSREWKTSWVSGNYYSDSGLKYLYLYYKPIYGKDKGGSLIIVDHEKIWQTAFSPSFRQDRKLNNKEISFWNTIPEYYQNLVLNYSPTYTDPPKKDYWY